MKKHQRVMSLAGRSPLMSYLRRAVRSNCQAKSQGVPIDEWVGMENSRATLNRRRFIKIGAAGILATPTITRQLFAEELDKKGDIVIVGAGIAGLNAAYTLKKSGISSQIYEASSRNGGRIFTRYGLFGENSATEVGGEFIDSNHADLLSLADELGLEVVDKTSGSDLKPAYYFGHHFISERKFVEELSPIVEQVLSDDSGLASEVSFRRPGRAKALDNLSIDQYLDKIGVRGWARKLIESAYVTEYGLDLDEQSALNFIFMFVDNESGGDIYPFGESDERYKIKEGNAQIAEQLAKRLTDQIHYSHRLIAISKKAKKYVATFEISDNKIVDVTADILVLTVPFNILREVDIRLELPEFKRNAIQNLGYGANTKVLTGANAKPWQLLGYSGETFTDMSFQLAWENTTQQETDETGITFFLGGSNAIHTGRMNAKIAACIYRSEFGNCYRAYDIFNDKAEKFHWPAHSFSKGSFSTYKPGQWTTIADAEFVPVDNIFFAGEHCSRGSQGMMNGAAESGRRVAELIIQKLA